LAQARRRLALELVTQAVTLFSPQLHRLVVVVAQTLEAQQAAALVVVVVNSPPIMLAVPELRVKAMQAVSVFIQGITAVVVVVVLVQQVLRQPQLRLV
jgi:hypothetical protein